ncbi:MAG: hypothetical protein GY835_01790 [bacterium]|nr:hypothetical protein [bacterium]
MKTRITSAIALVILTCSLADAAPRGDYFGQKPPGATPQVFAPGFISTEAFEFTGSFSPDGRTFLFTRRPTSRGSANRLRGTYRTGDKWSEPALPPFGRNIFESEALFSPDGNRVYFNSERPSPEGFDATPIWVVGFDGESWDEPRPVNWSLPRGFAMFATEADDGTLYTTCMGALKQAEPTDDGYGELTDVAPKYHFPWGAAHPFIAPDESYIIFDAQPDVMGETFIYVSFRTENDAWTKPQKLGPEVNANRSEFCATVSPDGKYLLFTRIVKDNGDIYWVDFSVVEQLRPPTE